MFVRFTMNGTIKDNSRGKVNKRRIFRMLYPALIVFFTFTFCESVFGIYKYFSYQDYIGRTEIVLLTLLWLILIIQIFSSFLRVYEMSKYIYPTLTFISDCVEVLLIIALAITIDNNIAKYNDIMFRLEYILIYEILIAIICNQWIWFISLRRLDKNAFIRLAVLLCVIIVLLIWELILPCVWNHVVFIAMFSVVTVLSIIDDKEVNPETISQ